MAKRRSKAQNKTLENNNRNAKRSNAFARKQWNYVLACFSIKSNRTTPESSQKQYVAPRPLGNPSDLIWGMSRLNVAKTLFFLDNSKEQRSKACIYALEERIISYRILSFQVVQAPAKWSKWRPQLQGVPPLVKHQSNPKSRFACKRSYSLPSKPAFIAKAWQRNKNHQ